MTETEYLKKLEQVKKYQANMKRKNLERVNSAEYKALQYEKAKARAIKSNSVKHNPIKCKQKTARKNTTPYISIFTDNMNVCYITGSTSNICPHHIFGAAKKSFSEKYGFILPLRTDWHTVTSYSIHKDRNLDLQYKRLCEEYWINELGKTKNEWIKECGCWY